MFSIDGRQPLEDKTHVVEPKHKVLGNCLMAGAFNFGLF